MSRCHKYPDDLKNWKIEGSNDGSNWREIDRQVNNYDLHGVNGQHYFPVDQPKGDFRYVKITSIGKSHRNSDFFEITNIEFFGIIKLNQLKDKFSIFSIFERRRLKFKMSNGKVQ